MYSVTEGGEFDDDGVANGVIVDPVGLATTASTNGGTLANALAATGENVMAFLLTIVVLIGGGVWVSPKALKK